MSKDNKPTRIVVKVGSSLVANTEELTVHYAFLHGLLADIAYLSSQGHQVILVSSGAVALGLKAMGYQPGTLSIAEKQASAACGQPQLMEAYRQLASTHGLKIAQILLTADDILKKDRALNIVNTFNRLFEASIVPIVNENDTVAVEELQVGDNDKLSASLAALMDADELILLTNTEGLWDGPPGKDGSSLITEISNPKGFLHLTDGKSTLGTGGMKTKLLAADIALSQGCLTRIGKGSLEKPISSLLFNKSKHTLVK